MGWSESYPYAGRQPPMARAAIRRRGHMNTGAGRRNYSQSERVIPSVDGNDYLMHQEESGDSLAHYGIFGMKWGVRRYQNEDGTLTAEGRERYGHLQDRGDSGLIKKYTLGSEGGQYAFAKWRERRHDKNLAKAKRSGNQKKIEKYESKKAAQGAANRNLDAYRRHSSTAKLVIQNSALSTIGGNAYRHARARGESRLSALAETALMGTLVGSIVRMSRDKKAYGKYIVYSGLDENGYFGNVIDR